MKAGLQETQKRTFLHFSFPLDHFFFFSSCFLTIRQGSVKPNIICRNNHLLWGKKKTKQNILTDSPADIFFKWDRYSCSFAPIFRKWFYTMKSRDSKVHSEIQPPVLGR